MKLPAAQIGEFLRNPPPRIVAALIHGGDTGLVRERADAILGAILGPAKDDPFRSAVLIAEALRQDPALLADEAASLSLIGGRRVVRVRDATDGLAKTLPPVLASATGESFLLFEAGDLPGSSALRHLFDAAPNAVSIPCYADDVRAISQLIREMAEAKRVKIEPDALTYLSQNMGSDRLVTRQEIEKLLIYAGDGGRVSFAEAIASVGDSSAVTMEQVVYDSLDGKASAVDAGLSRLFLEGVSPVPILRAAQRHVQRLHLCALRIAAGERAEAVVTSLRPPVFYQLQPRFKAQLTHWPPPRAQRLLSLLTRAELDCKTTGSPDETLCRHLLTAADRLPGRPSR